MPDGLDHPDLARVGASMRAEWHADADVATREAEEQWRRSRTIVDWLLERMHAGDTIAASCAGQRFTGRVDEVGPDVVGMRTAFARIDVHLAPGSVGAAQFELVERASSGGWRSSTRRTFRDVVIAREQADQVTVGTLDAPAGIDCRLFAGRDFATLVLPDGGELAVPFAAMSWIALHTA
jgi:hypothetical protein